jgi:hypothetical protein
VAGGSRSQARPIFGNPSGSSLTSLAYIGSMKRISAFGNALRVFAFIKEAAKFSLYIPEERRSQYATFKVK